MIFTQTALPGVVVIEPRVYGDERGFFMETWRASRYAEAGITAPFVQDNHSRSEYGVLRGLHYQVRQPQGKLVRVVSGEVFDVAVDLRRGSSTFGKWVGETLSSRNHRMMWIPPGFAHGFLVTADHAEFVYKCTDYYASEFERTLLWNDARVGVAWPIADDMPLRLSDKDARGLDLSQAEIYPPSDGGV